MKLWWGYVKQDMIRFCLFQQNAQVWNKKIWWPKSTSSSMMRVAVCIYSWACMCSCVQVCWPWPGASMRRQASTWQVARRCPVDHSWRWSAPVDSRRPPAVHSQSQREHWLTSASAQPITVSQSSQQLISTTVPKYQPILKQRQGHGNLIKQKVTCGLSNSAISNDTWVTFKSFTVSSLFNCVAIDPQWRTGDGDFSVSLKQSINLNSLNTITTGMDRGAVPLQQMISSNECLMRRS